MKSVCFIIDDINFSGGAHVATFLLIRRLLKLCVHVEVLTLTGPTGKVYEKLGDVKINVMPYPTAGLRRFVCGIIRRIGFGWYPVWAFDPNRKWHKYLCHFDTVCCVGEPSILRWFTASLPNKIHKVIMIHTDYSCWHRISNETRRITRFDRFLYGEMDVIGVVGKCNAEKMKATIPALAEKIKPFHNIIEAPIITRDPRSNASNKGDVLKIVTLSRLEWGPPKKTDALIRVAAKLKGSQVRFDWDVYGAGDRSRLDALVVELGVGDVFHMRGFSKDAQLRLAEADISVMLSDYEGLSNGIYESMMLGVPVFSTNVGGAAEQIDDGSNGWLVLKDEDLIFEKLHSVLSNKAAIAKVRENLQSYKYDNEIALKENFGLLGLAI